MCASEKGKNQWMVKEHSSSLGGKKTGPLWEKEKEHKGGERI